MDSDPDFLVNITSLSKLLLFEYAKSLQLVAVGLLYRC